MRTSHAVLLLGAIPLLATSGCKSRAPALESPFSDNFSRVGIGPDWLDTGRSGRIKDGKLNLELTHNHPIWLRRKLPSNVQIDFDAVSNNPSGDIKVELFGDGESFDPDRGQYDPTSYVIVLGGWDNSKSIIGRLGEHDDTVKASRMREGDQPMVVPGRTYHFSITRRAGVIDWKLDGAAYLSWTDPQPLQGPGHEFFAINGWEAEVSFDNLTIRPATP